jgi:polysaccharide biosynthesis transport protein
MSMIPARQTAGFTAVPNEVLAPQAPVGRPEPSRPSIVSQLITIALRRRWLLIGTLLGSLVLGLIVTVLMSPSYTASATIEIRRESGGLVELDASQAATASRDVEFYETQYGLLRSDSLSQRVARELGLGDNEAFFDMMGVPQADDWFGEGKLTNTAPSKDERVRIAGMALLNHLDVEPVRLSRLVELRLSSPDPALSQKIVNAWARLFIEQTLERRFEESSYARQFLEGRLAQLRTRIDASERRLVDYASQEGIINLPGVVAGAGGATGERSLAADDLAALNSALAQATADRVQAQSRLSAPMSGPEALQNGAISGLRQTRAELSGEYAKLMQQFEPDYPPAKALQEQIAQLDRAISTEERRVSGSVRGQYETSLAREQALSERVNALKTSLLDVRRRSIQYNIFKRDVDTNQQLYDALLQRYKTIGVAGGVGTNNISIVDKAELPRVPSSPNLLLNLAIAAVAGLLLGAGIAWLLEQLHQGVNDPADVEQAFGVPLLGTIPKSEKNPVLEDLRDPKSATTEAYLSLRTRLAFTTHHGVPKTIAVTSTAPAEGKSTTSFALAQLLAQTSPRGAVLIDGDMRSPSIHGMFGLGNQQGLSNYLAGDDDLDTLLQLSGTTSLAVMAAGPRPPSTPDLLTGERMPLLMRELLKRFDHIVIDMPPVMGLADTLLVGGQVEGLLFVTEAHRTKISLATGAMHRLLSAGLTPLGVVLTKYDPKQGHFGYGYGYGYGYGNDRNGNEPA